MTPPQFPESRFKRILFCTDFSESADAAFEFALDAAVRRPGSTLYLLHVIHEPDAQYWKTMLAEVENVNADAKKAIDAKVAAAYLSRGFRRRISRPSTVQIHCDAVTSSAHIFASAAVENASTRSVSTPAAFGVPVTVSCSHASGPAVIEAVAAPVPSIPGPVSVTFGCGPPP